MNLDLFEPPIARRTDPPTSKASAQRHTRSGRRARDRARLLSLVTEQPMRTSMEYAQLLIDRGLPWLKAYQIASKRISDLEHGKLVRPAGERICEVSGHRARVWVAT